MGSTAKNANSGDEEADDGIGSLCCCCCRAACCCCRGIRRFTRWIVGALCRRKVEDYLLFVIAQVFVGIGFFSSIGLIAHQYANEVLPALAANTVSIGYSAIQTVSTGVTGLYDQAMPMLNNTANTINQFSQYGSLAFSAIGNMTRDGYDTISPFLNQTTNYLRKKLDQGV